MVVLESSYIFDLIGGVPEAIEAGNTIADSGEVQWLPTPVSGEVYYGVYFTQSEDERRRVQNALLGYPRVEINDEIARIASRLLAEADKEAGGDCGVGAVDSYIAAVAAVMDDAVLTANDQDFATLGVDTRPYRDREA